MSNEELNQYLDELDGDMLDGYHEYAHACVEPWHSFDGNHGQLTIIKKHILPAAEGHAHDAKQDWPFSETTNHYLYEIWKSYDSDVIARAFTETIDEIFSEIESIWRWSIHLQINHAGAAGGGENRGPHSTHGVWRGTEEGPIFVDFPKFVG